MLLYLVRHAEANPEEIDPTRGLSEKGLADIKKTAQHAAGRPVKISRIFHSKKKRALQTAEILAAELHPKKGISETDGLAPRDEPEIWAERLSSVEEDIMLVGHLPHMANLASLLIHKNISASTFESAAIVCLGKNRAGSISLEWKISPGQIT